MKKVFIFLLLLYTAISATTVDMKPKYTLKATGGVQDMVYSKSKLYAATDNGTVEIFNIKNRKKIKSIKIPKIKDFMGDDIASKIYSVDICHDSIVFVSQGAKGYRQLWLYKDNKNVEIIGIDKHLLARKALFVDDNRIIIGLLSNQILLYDIKKGDFIYNVQVSSSSFSDFVLSEDKKRVFVADESGIIREIDTSNGKEIRVVGEKNLDKVYQIDYKNGTLLTAGQDRKSVVYLKYSNYEFSFSFLLYSCGLSPDAKYGAVAYNENNDVIVFDISTKTKKYNLVGQDATLTKILFINNKELFTSSDSKNINFWKLK